MLYIRFYIMMLSCLYSLVSLIMLLMIGFNFKKLCSEIEGD